MMNAMSTGDFQVRVESTNNRGFTPEEISIRCVDKIVSVSENSHPEIQEQAKAFKHQVANVVKFYLTEAVKSDRTTIFNALMDAGHPELAELIRRL